jgi:Relaxase/Mobilisation nuclease domain
MIIKGAARGNPKWLAHHLHRTDINEIAQLIEIRGLVADDTLGALREIAATAACTKARDALYHANLDPRAGEILTAEQWARSVEILEATLGFDGQPRVVVRHVKGGREHYHVVWSRIDVDQRRAISDSLNYRKHEEVARRLEREFGHERVQGALIERDRIDRPKRTPSRAEMMQTEKSGIEPAAVKAELTRLWQQTDTGKTFAAAVQDAGYRLARGDKCDFIVIDQAGQVHSLGRRIDGAKAKDIRARMADIDPAGLPDAAGAKAIQVQATKVPPSQPPAEPAIDTKEMSDARPGYDRYDRFGSRKPRPGPASGGPSTVSLDSLPELCGVTLAEHLNDPPVLLPRDARHNLDVDGAGRRTDGLRRADAGIAPSPKPPTTVEEPAAPDLPEVSVEETRARIAEEIIILEHQIAAGAIAEAAGARERQALKDRRQAAAEASERLRGGLAGAYLDPETAEAKWKSLKKRYGTGRAARFVERNPSLLGPLKGRTFLFGLFPDRDRWAAVQTARLSVRHAINAGRAWAAYFSEKPMRESAATMAERQPEVQAAHQAFAALPTLRAKLAEIDELDPARKRAKQIQRAIPIMLEYHRSGRRVEADAILDRLDEEAIAALRTKLEEQATRHQRALGATPAQALDRLIHRRQKTPQGERRVGWQPTSPRRKN